VVVCDGKSGGRKVAGSRCSDIENIWSIFGGKMWKECWVIIADESSSCLVNSVYMNKEEAEEWVKKENSKIGCDFYYIEQSQLIE
jgi:hypothetical protein